MDNALLQSSLKAIDAITGGAASRSHTNSDGSRPQWGGNGPVTETYRASGPLDTDVLPQGAALNQQANLGVFQRIRNSAEWLRFVSFRPVTENSGHLDLWDDESFTMHPTSQAGPRTNIPVRSPDISTNKFETRLISGAFGLRLKSLRAAAAAGRDPNALVQTGLINGIARVFATCGIGGDVDLPSGGTGVPDDIIMRSSVDGWFKKLRTAGVNYSAVDDGFSYHNEIWAGMLDQIDPGYRSNPALAWGVPDKISTRYLKEVTGAKQSGGEALSRVNELGQAFMNVMGNQARPLGKPTVVIPQIATDGWGLEGYAGLAPTSVTDNGNGTITLNVNTLAGSGTNRGASGADGQRYVTVTNLSTGVTETRPVAYSAPNNTITTATKLGQSSVSTTAADYSVRWGDQTSMCLGLWRLFTMVIQNGLRIYTVFYPRDEIVEVIVHADVDYLVVDPTGASLVDTIIAPRSVIIPAS